MLSHPIRLKVIGKRKKKDCRYLACYIPLQKISDYAFEQIFLKIKHDHGAGLRDELIFRKKHGELRGGLNNYKKKYDFIRGKYKKAISDGLPNKVVWTFINNELRKKGYKKLSVERLRKIV